MHCGIPSWNRDAAMEKPSGFCTLEHLLLGRIARGVVGDPPPGIIRTASCARCGAPFVVVRRRAGRLPRDCARCWLRAAAASAGFRMPHVARERRVCANPACARVFDGVGRKRFCTRSCSRAMRLRPVTVVERTCLRCRTVFSVERHGARGQAGWYGSKRGPFCSRRCHDLFHQEAAGRPEVERVCRRCRAPFRVVQKGHKPPRLYCSLECKNHARDDMDGLVELVASVCEQCRTPFSAAIRREDEPVRYCSPECRELAGEPALPGRQRLVVARCEQCSSCFTYRHGQDRGRRFCSARCQRRAATDRLVARNRQRPAPCVICRADTRLGRPGIPPLCCSATCEDALAVLRSTRRCGECGGEFLAGSESSTARLCPSCRSRNATSPLGRSGLGAGPGRSQPAAALRREDAGRLRRARDLAVEVAMLLGTAAYEAEVRPEAAGAPALGEAQRAAEQAAALLGTLTRTPVGRLTPLHVPAGAGGMRALEDAAGEVATGLSQAAAALGRGDGTAAAAAADLAAGHLGPLIATLAVQRRGAGRRSAA
jgi:hypothetical protein